MLEDLPAVTEEQGFSGSHGALTFQDTLHCRAGGHPLLDLTLEL